ncbi:MAG TPA: NRDE family protein, partial [Rhodocyclaceae bacterium]|nr:NRDE family protein [Rhodocyclaceae bacterium]
MCLILVAWQTHPDFPLVVAANRDEFHARPTATVGRWENAPAIIAGRDLEAGGTWLGITDTGRFAAVTNVREPGQPKGRLSRGELTAVFLAGDDTPADFAEHIDDSAYSGFNLLLADRQQLC